MTGFKTVSVFLCRVRQMNGELLLGRGARVLPHLRRPLDPLVRDPLVAVGHRTAEMERPEKQATDINIYD